MSSRTAQDIARINRADRLRKLNSEIKLVIWDLNGTILNDLEYMYTHGMCHIFNHFNVSPPSIEQYRNETTADFLKFYHKYGIPSDQIENDLNNLLKNNYANQVEHPPLHEDVVESLQKINWHGIDQSLVTAFNEDSTRAILKAASITNYFYEIKTHVSKKTEVILEMINVCGIVPSNVIGITDTVNDIKAFIDAGIKPYICYRGFHTLEYIQDMQAEYPEMILVPDFKEIIKLQNWD